MIVISIHIYMILVHYRSLSLDIPVTRECVVGSAYYFICMYMMYI